MDKDQILSRAQRYVGAETHDFFRRQVTDLIDNDDIDELGDRFYRDLEFGTGGLRGVIGGGYNRMNPFTVKRATQGLSNYVKKAARGHSPSAVVAFDSRHFSDLFALETALVFCANGIKTSLFTSLRPTPELSFAVRHLGADTGVVITASHNPRQYNGYKAYWNDGAQVVPPHDGAIIREVLTVSDIRSMTREEAVARGLLTMIDAQVDDAYIAMIKGMSLRPAMVREKGPSLKVVYTPLHGSGGMLIERVLRELGMPVTLVQAQSAPDGDFPTVQSPNPEEGSAMRLACDLAVQVKADLVIGTDPDADRIGIAVPDGGTYRLISGNQFGALAADYVFSTLREQGAMPVKPAFIKTIVTTELQRAIVEKHKVPCFDVLTGFKYIAEKIREWELSPTGHSFVFGGEESYGFLMGTAVRDKDAVSAAALIAETALHLLTNGKSVIQRLNELFTEFGYHAETQISKNFEGQAGAEVMAGLMQGIRKNPPAIFAGQKVTAVKDYLDGTVYTSAAGKKEQSISLPGANVLQLVLADASIVTVRPSGTEPKIKFYIMYSGKPGVDVDKAEKIAEETITAISKAINALIP